MYIIKQNKEGKWIIIKKGAKRATKVFENKYDAMSYAKDKYGDYELEDEYEEVKKIIKKKPIIFVILLVVMILIVAGVAFLYSQGYLNPIINPEVPTTTTPTTTPSVTPTTIPTTVEPAAGEIVENFIYDDFQIHFLTMGDDTMSSNYSKYSGDSIYIKAGDNDILIDAGSRQGSSEYIKKYVDNYCIDGKLEYVIATHADQDHIAGFIGTTKAPGIFEAYDIDILIDFVYSNKDLTTSSGNDTLYGKYVKGREELKNNGTKCYTAAECYNEESGAKKSYTIGNNIEFTILYNSYYFEQSSDENNHSVCTLFTYNDKNFLLTGDLEKEGEEKLAEFYDGSTTAKTLPHCVLYKAGHHGSKTSSNDVLLSKITPKICCVCCCAGSDEYTKNYNNIFPTQDFITRIAKYTERVYVTSVMNEETDEPEKLNGDIIISSNGEYVGISAYSLTKLKDTAWFNQTIYVDENNNVVTSNTSGSKSVVRRIWPT